MRGIISVSLLTLGLLAVSPVWAQETSDELQIIEFDYDHQSGPPAVNLPPTLQTPPDPPAPGTSQAPVPVLAPADQPAAKTAPASQSAPAAKTAPGAKTAPAAKSQTAPESSPAAPKTSTRPRKADKPGSSSEPEKVISIIGEPETPTAAGGAGAKPAASGPSDEELLDSLFGPMDQPSAAGSPPATTLTPAAGSTTAVPAAPNGIQVEKPKKVGPRTPTVSPLRPPVTPEPEQVRVEKSPEKKPKDTAKTAPSTTRKSQARMPADKSAAPAAGAFNPYRRAAIDPRTRPKPVTAAAYPAGRGVSWADYRHWELGTYNWSLVHAGPAKAQELAPGRSVVPINRALIPAGGPPPKNFW